MGVVLLKKRRNSCLYSITKSTSHHVFRPALSLEVFPFAVVNSRARIFGIELFLKGGERLNFGPQIFGGFG